MLVNSSDKNCLYEYNWPKYFVYKWNENNSFTTPHLSVHTTCHVLLWSLISTAKFISCFAFSSMWKDIVNHLKMWSFIFIIFCFVFFFVFLFFSIMKHNWGSKFTLGNLWSAQLFSPCLPSLPHCNAVFLPSLFYFLLQPLNKLGDSKERGWHFFTLSTLRNFCKNRPHCFVMMCHRWFLLNPCYYKSQIFFFCFISSKIKISLILWRFHWQVFSKFYIL